MQIFQAFPSYENTVGPLVAELLTRYASFMTMRVMTASRFRGVSRSASNLLKDVILSEGDELIPSGFNWTEEGNFACMAAPRTRQPDYSHLQLDAREIRALRFSMLPMSDEMPAFSLHPPEDFGQLKTKNYPAMDKVELGTVVDSLVSRTAPGSKGKTWQQVFAVQVDREQRERAKNALNNHNAFGTW